MNKGYRIVIVDDQQLFMEGLKNIIELEDDLKVVGTAKNGREGYELIKTIRPDLVLCDIRMPEMNGIELLEAVKSDWKEARILLLTTFEEDEYLLQALSLGACGFMIKNVSADDLVENIRRSLAGQWVMPQNLTGRLAQYLQGGKKQVETPADRRILLKQRYSLTDREIDICDLLIEGMENDAIAKTLYIGIGTVKNYLTSIYAKMDVPHRTAAVLALKESS
jgi:DNA-binding NarL/FixJ family response regulator